MSRRDMVEIIRAMDAVRGYLALGMAEEAWESLEDLPAEQRALPEVQHMRLKIHQLLERWESAVSLAESLVRKFPENPDWWLEWAKTLAVDGRLQRARGVMWEACQVHPANALMFYHLASFEFCLGDDIDAKRHLSMAFMLDPELRRKADVDPNLEGITGNG